MAEVSSTVRHSPPGVSRTWADSLTELLATEPSAKACHSCGSQQLRPGSAPSETLCPPRQPCRQACFHM